MAKYKIPDPSGTNLDPLGFEKNFVKPQNTANPDFGTGVADSLEFVTPVKIEPGYGTLGNSQVAQQYYNERQAYDEGTLSLTGKFVKNAVGTLVTEVGKLPGYVGGGIAAVGNEVFGDGKDSMKLMVDNAWVNAFESIDESIKEFIPVTLSKSVQDGNLGDKLSSGAWWATTGADGIGFLMSMFVPGAAIKAAKLGKLAAPVAEAVANLGNKGEKFVLGLEGQRKAEGLASMFANASFESAAEAANTFDNVKTKYVNEGLSEEEANAKAGEAAAAVFKTNMVILPLSNMLDEIYLFKSLGKVKEAKAADSVLAKLFKNGVIDTELAAKLTRLASAKSIGKYMKGLAGASVKEGVFEEGLQTITQQQVEEGNIESNPFKQLWSSITNYTDDFWNNKELHESIALGGILGGGMSLISTTNEINDLKSALYGKTAKSNWATKLGLATEGKDQRGLISLITQNFNDNFRSVRDLQIVNEDGKTVIDQTKLAELPEQQRNLLALHLAYDAAVSTNNEVAKAQLGATLAENYVSAFLGNEGSEYLYKEHVTKQLLPEWSKRYEEQYGRQPNSEQQKEFLDTFQQQGDLVFKSYNKALNTHQPERYVRPKQGEESLYSEFKQQYFREKYQTLIQLNTLENLESEIKDKLQKEQIYFDNFTGKFNENLNNLLNDQGLTAVQKQTLRDITPVVNELQKVRSELEEHYNNLHSKKGAQELYNVVKSKREVRQEFEAEVQNTHAQTVQQATNQVSQDDVLFEDFVKSFEENMDDFGVGTAQDQDGNIYQITRNDRDELVATDVQGSVVLNGEIIRMNNLTMVPPQLQTAVQTPSLPTPAELNLDAINQLRLELQTDQWPVSDQILHDTLMSENLSTIQRRFREPLSRAKKILSRYKELLGGFSTPPPSVPETTVDESPRWELNDQSNTLYPSTGVHVQYDVNRNGEVRDKLTVNGLPLLTDSVEQQRWFSKVNEVSPSTHAVRVVAMSDLDKLDSKYQQQIKSNLGSDTRPTDLFIVLTTKDGELITDEGGIFFTSLWRPTTLYKQLDKKFESRLAPDAWMGGFLKAKGIVADLSLVVADMNTLKPDDLQKLGLSSKATYSDFQLAAFEWARDNYTKWYENLNKLQSQGNVILNILEKSDGREVVKRDAQGNIIWNSVLTNIPGLSINRGKLVGGKLVQSYTGKIDLGNREISVTPGETVLITKENYVHRLKQRNISKNEAEVIIFLLQQRSNGATLESINLDVEIDTGREKRTENRPVLWAKEKYSLINSLINFSTSPSDTKYSIYFQGKDLVFIDSNGVKHTINESDINTGNTLLMNFLQSKKLNINEKLLKDNGKHEVISVVVDQNGNRNLKITLGKNTYQEELLKSNSLLTRSVIEPGYPKRLQMNLHLAPDVKVSSTTKSSEEIEIEAINKRRQEEHANNKYPANKVGSNRDKFGRGQDIYEINGQTYYVDYKKNESVPVIYKVPPSEIDAKYDAEIAKLNQSNKKNTSTETPRQRSRPKPPPQLEVDKVFNPQQLLDQKLKSGEIKQICK